MEKLVIEDLLWKNVFEQPICEYIKYFVIMIVFFRILSLFRLTKQAKTMVYAKHEEQMLPRIWYIFLFIKSPPHF